MMKRFVIISLVLLTGVYALLTVLDSGEYKTERALWKINKKFGSLVKNRAPVTDYEFGQLKGQYENYVRRYHKSPLSVEGQIMLGNLYIYRKDFPAARTEFVKALPLSNGNQELMAKVEADIAQSYQYEGDWDQALAQYKAVNQRYPLTKTGFFVPMYVGRYYESKGMKAQANSAYEEAYQFYKNILTQYPKSSLAYESMNLMSLSRLSQGRYAEAVQGMEEWIMTYPRGYSLKEAIRTINTLCVTQLHDYAMAIKIYQRFIQRYPKHGVVPILKNMITQLELLQRKGVTIRPKKP